MMSNEGVFKWISHYFEMAVDFWKTIFSFHLTYLDKTELSMTTVANYIREGSKGSTVGWNTEKRVQYLAKLLCLPQRLKSMFFKFFQKMSILAFEVIVQPLAHIKISFCTIFPLFNTLCWWIKAQALQTSSCQHIS